METARLTQFLPADPEPRNFTRQVPGASFSWVTPTPVSAPRLLAWSDEVAQLVGMQPTPEVIAMLAGNHVPSGVQPVATRYGGHQFGQWAGQLGDGRAILLGEQQGLEIQLKGAGPTPYSRRADGRAVLRSSLREYLCSEAMHHLGVPTTRALALVATGDDVVRDMFYNGNAAPEPGAICTRVAPSFLRFGNYQIHAAMGEVDVLKKLVDYTLTFYPGHDLTSFFHELCGRTARLMVDWWRVGFVHGVMNTDNLSVLGLTIDYGPYGWLDVYDPEWTPNTTDAQTRRYRFSQQPNIALWNLHQLAGALSVLGLKPEAALAHYEKTFVAEWETMLSAKLGLRSFHPALIGELDTLMRQQEIDPTLFYRLIAEDAFPEDAFYQPLGSEARASFSSWLARWRSLGPDVELMNRTNPAVIFRNYLAQEAIDGLMQNDPAPLERLTQALRTPYILDEASRPYFIRRPEWARDRAGCSALSCSS